MFTAAASVQRPVAPRREFKFPCLYHHIKKQMIWWIWWSSGILYGNLRKHDETFSSFDVSDLIVVTAVGLGLFAAALKQSCKVKLCFHSWLSQLAVWQIRSQSLVGWPASNSCTHLDRNTHCRHGATQNHTLLAEQWLHCCLELTYFFFLSSTQSGTPTSWPPPPTKPHHRSEASYCIRLAVNCGFKISLFNCSAWFLTDSSGAQGNTLIRTSHNFKLLKWLQIFVFSLFENHPDNMCKKSGYQYDWVYSVKICR